MVKTSDIFKDRLVWIILFAVLFIGIFVGSTIFNNVDKNNLKISDSDDNSVVKEEVTKPKPILLEGVGQTATKEFNLQSGRARIESINKGGDNNFTVYLVDHTGNEIELLANELGGDSITSKVINISDNGEYALNVAGNGTWKVTITQ